MGRACDSGDPFRPATVLRFACLPGILAALLVAALPAASRACTTFCLRGPHQPVFGRNYDWDVEDGLVMVNKRRVAKKSSTEGNPASWVSNYGSVTFNQYGREAPTGGMNEVGLVVECMWLSGTEYPVPDSRPEVGELKWIQYQLDTASSVAEVLASDARIRISTEQTSPIHFLVCDRQGECATIEFLGGELVAHTGDQLPAAALTNHTYRQGRSFLRQVAGDETSPAFAGANYSLKRFFWAHQGVTSYRPESSGPAVDHAFDVLEKVAVDRTQWRIVYELGAGRVHYRTRSQPAIRTVDLAELDFACRTPVKILDLARPGGGEVSDAFGDYTWEANYDLIRRSFSKTSFLQNVPAEMLRRLARYPETMECLRSPPSE